MDMIWSLIIGGLIGWAGDVISRQELLGRRIGSFIFGFLGSWTGQLLFPDWGPSISSIVILPSVLGSIIAICLLIICSTVFKNFKNKL